MYLLYLDDSGLVGDPKQRHCVIAGVCVFERETHWVEQDINAIAARFNSNQPYEIELHASPMLARRGYWRSIPAADCQQAIVDALSSAVCKRWGVRLFGAVVRKDRMAGKDITEHLFEQVSSRFDMFLARKYKKEKEQARGIIIFDKSKHEGRIQSLCRKYKFEGHQYGNIRNFAEVPLFIDSKASRLMQVADLVAYALFRYYERGDDTFFAVIRDHFDAEGGVVHGLHEMV